MVKVTIHLEFDEETEETIGDSDVYNYLSDLMSNDALDYEIECADDNMSGIDEHGRHFFHQTFWGRKFKTYFQPMP